MALGPVPPRSTASPRGPGRGPEECSGDGQRLDAPSCWPGHRNLGARVHIGELTDSREAGDTAQHPRAPGHQHWGSLPAYTSKATPSPREQGQAQESRWDGGRHRIPVGWGQPGRHTLP